MKRSCRATLFALLLLMLGAAAGWSQDAVEATPLEEPEVAEEILDAKKIFILNTVMDFSLASAFTTEIMDWERFEVVFSEEDADLCFALSAQADYQKQEIPSGDSQDDEMRPRAVGTMRTLDRLYFKIFIPGGDDLWQDEADVGEGSEAAVELVQRLRERIEAKESEGDSETGR